MHTSTRTAAPGIARFDDGPTGSLLPVSNDRVSSLRDSGHSIAPYTHAGGHHSTSAPHPAGGAHGHSKRARGPLDSMDPGRRSRSPRDALMGARGGGSDLYLPDQPGAPSSRFGGPATGRTAYGAGAGGYGPHYTPMFAGGGGAHGPSPPTPSFIPVPPQQQQLPPFGSVGAARDSYDDAGRPRFADAAPYDYPGMISGRGGGGYAGSVQHHQTPRGDMFAGFLDADDGRRPPGRASDVGRGGNGMEWPSHDGAPVGRDRSIMEPGTFFPSSFLLIFSFLCSLLTLPSIGPPLSLTTGSQETWFDMFSNPNSSGTGTSTSSVPHLHGQPPKAPSRGPAPWERGPVPSSTAGPSSMDDLATIFGAENVPTAAGAATSRTPGTASGRSSAAPHAVVEIPAAAQPARAGEDVRMNTPLAARPASSQAGSTAGASASAGAGAGAGAGASADAEMRDGDGDADADADADAEGDASSAPEVDMDNRERDAEGEQDVEAEQAK